MCRVTERPKTSPACRLLLRALAGYKYALSPLFGNCCRFYPSCSDYAAEAIRKRGALQGCALAAWRVLRCNPLCQGGYDPI